MIMKPLGPTSRSGPERASRRRGGFTLWELSTVMLIVAIASTLAIPAFVNFSAEKTLTGSDILMKLLRDTRSVAIEHAVEVTLVIDPKNGHFRIDTASTFGTGKVVEDSLRLGFTDALETDLPRLRYIFRATGAAFADSVTVRSVDSTRVVIVDPWSGIPRAIAR
jgi:prepilin-type N-terminal cleavage/methylation domain-containing protein